MYSITFCLMSAIRAIEFVMAGRTSCAMPILSVAAPGEHADEGGQACGRSPPCQAWRQKAAVAERRTYAGQQDVSHTKNATDEDR